MMTKETIGKILKLFATRQNNARIHYPEFCEYIKKYAQHHLEADPTLIAYVGDTENSIDKDILSLEEEGSIIITGDTFENKTLIVVDFIIQRYANKYKEGLHNPQIPFPLVNDFSKHFPQEMIEPIQATDILPILLEKESEKTQDKTENLKLYGLSFNQTIPAILFPATIPITFLFELCLNKMRQMLKKEEYYDYFFKKLKISNPTKELSVKTFFVQFMQKPEEAIESLKNTGEGFYYWSQLCFFLRQDYAKIKDYNQKDVSILHAVLLTEIIIVFYKNKAQQDYQKNIALRSLTQQFNKPPFYFNRTAIEQFTDTKGILLLGQYTQDDLVKFLHDETTELDNDNLPRLLTFKLDSGKFFYIYKAKVMSVVQHFIEDARITIKDTLIKEYFTTYKRFDIPPSANNQPLFEERLGELIYTESPMLHTLLDATFLPLVYHENLENKNEHENVKLFSNGELIPYSEILLISRHEIIADAKILLPFWYAIPIIPWIMRLFTKKPEKKQKKSISAQISPIQTLETNTSESATYDKTTKKDELKKVALNAEKILVPESSTLERELEACKNEWNKIIDKKLSNNLTEDVNSLIRDYLRKTLRTLRSSQFTADRIKNLAEILMKSPSLQKIKHPVELQAYIGLYIIKLLKNL